MNRQIGVVAATGLAVLALAGCGGAAVTATTPPATVTASATVSRQDAMLTDRADGLATLHARETYLPLTPSQTPRPTATPGAPTQIPTPAPSLVDLGLDLPYVSDGGAVPSGAVTRIGVGHVRQADFYPNQLRLMLGTSTGIYVYDLPGFERVWRRYLGQDPWEVSLAENGARIVASFGWNASPTLYDAGSGDKIANLDGWHGPHWSPDSSIIAIEAMPSFGEDSSTFTGRIWLYDSTTGSLLRALEAQINGFWGGVFSVIEWSPDGRTLAACGDQAIYIWDAETGAPLHIAGADSTTGGLYLRYCGMAFSPDGTYLAVQDADRLFVVDLISGETAFEISGGGLAFTWSPGRLYLMHRESVEVYDSATWSQVRSIGSGVEINDLAVSPSGEQVAIAMNGSTLVLATTSLDTVYTLAKTFDRIYWSPGGRWLVGRQGTTYSIIDSTSHIEVFSLPETDGGILFADEESLLVIDGYHALLLDLATGGFIGGARLGIPVEQMAWSQNGSTLILSGAEGEWYWSEDTGRLDRVPPTFVTAGPTVALSEGDWRNPVPDSVSPDGTLRAVPVTVDAGCGDGPWGGGCGIWSSKFEIYQKDSTEPSITLDFPSSGATAVAWSADSRMLAIGLGTMDNLLSADQIVVIDPNTGEELFVFEGHLGDIAGLLFSPNGMRLASASQDGTVVVWNTGH